MKIVFISYWGINDPLSVATVYPHIDILAKMDKVEEIHLLSFERGHFESHQFAKKVIHYPIQESKFPPGLNKFLSFFKAWKVLKSIELKLNIDFCICRSSFAGILGYHLKKKFGTPFLVESLEPHTDYMILSGEWSRNGVKSKILRRYEKLIFEHAKFLLPVSNNYERRLLEQGFNQDRIKVLPCTVDENQFAFNLQERQILRKKLNIEDSSNVGIYVGKFGGIYYEALAYKLFKTLNDNVDNLTLIILTPEDKEIVVQELMKIGFQDSRIHVLRVAPKEVPNYLSASDFGIAIYKESEFSDCLSPIKVGEYLINGLPIVMTKNIGEDSELIQKEKIGATFRFIDGEVDLKMNNFMLLLNSKETREKINQIGIQYRGRNISNTVYSEIFE